jgi:hypothetical protein
MGTFPASVAGGGEVPTRPNGRYSDRPNAGAGLPGRR